MFRFLKEKLKKALGRISEKVEEPSEEKKKEKEVKRGIVEKIKAKITKKKISEELFERLFWDLELSLLENNTAVEIIQELKEKLRKELVGREVSRSELKDIILNTLKDEISSVIEGVDLVELIKEKLQKKKPCVICFFGVNGSGKTTTIAKIANLLKKNGLSVVLAASDTFRAAAIDQLEEHANRLGVKLIKHRYGADAAAVAFDAIKHAEAKGIDVVLIDTAGRMHSDVNLMDEMKKIVRVAKPELKVFVGESIVGNDCVEQARRFDQAVGIDAVILTKADVDEKGGAIVSISKVVGKPIAFLGIGQGYDDLIKVNKESILRSVGI